VRYYFGMATMMTIKGQVTVPKNIRDHLGIGPGTRIAFCVEADGRVTLRRAEEPVARPGFERFIGIAGGGLTTDEVMGMTRGSD
jgi:AbrB family looped-hinge helix DNA binding protein